MFNLQFVLFQDCDVPVGGGPMTAARSAVDVQDGYAEELRLIIGEFS